MSQDPEENGLAPDDALFVRPYVAPSGPPARAEAPAWPQSGPFAFPDPADDPAGEPADGFAGGFAAGRGHRPDDGVPAPVTGPTRPPAAAARHARPAAGPARRSRLPLAVGTVLGLAAVGGLVLLLTGPDPQPPRAEAPADLTVPALPGGPGGGAESPDPTVSARSAAPSASPTGASATTTGPAAKPSTAAGAAVRPSSGYATLRMGDSGPEVRALQELLQGQGFTYVSVTGVYDGQTKRGVGQLQRDRSIKGDPQGVYGPNTQAAMGG
ncbi:peptidoglycan-binding protein [Streptomyces sp. gCLA4]|uniref:peptidoglycan-binding domain-containing protein n=1 Tax=Streptomyces sp. gCLA4 TaxID=1873416 RepID=UPI0016016B61|nr:peptidoglycan-binding domain-containing protein [Streptomyces sp. gCLA4]